MQSDDLIKADRWVQIHIRPRPCQCRREGRFRILPSDIFPECGTSLFIEEYSNGIIMIASGRKNAIESGHDVKTGSGMAMYVRSGVIHNKLFSHR